MNPPPEISKFDIPLVHKVFELHKKIYLAYSKIPKKDRFGIWLKTENICLEVIDYIIAASLENKSAKFPPLNSARIKTEILKRFIRTARELNIIENKRYLFLEADLQEISKMINGWIKYLR
jgi:hypothetical protein